MKTSIRASLIIALTAIGGLSAPASHAAGENIQLTGAGATFPYPLYSKWFSEFHSADPSVEINYQSIGSGGGIRQLLDKTIDFGASDAPMTDEQLAKATAPILHFPTVLGAVVVTYNLPGIKQTLKLSSDVIADIFLGKITKWSDARIKKLNPAIQVAADLPIIVVHRSDGSGTTAVFADYLTKVSPDWKATVGSGTALKWPVGLGGKGNEGVTGVLKQTPGAVGYTELTYAESNHLPVAEIKNASGAFVAPTPKNITAAAAATLKDIPADFRVSITNTLGKSAYPISSFTYLLAYKNMDEGKSAKFKKFLAWAMGPGQKLAEPLSYAPLPASLVKKVQTQIKELP
jgi:phosphate transport system substrate-binding protein